MHRKWTLLDDAEWQCACGSSATALASTGTIHAANAPFATAHVTAATIATTALTTTSSEGAVATDATAF